MVSSSSSSSTTTPSLRVKIPAAGENKLTINVKSPTSEIYAEVKQADKVKDLEKLIKKAWGDDYIALYHKSMVMKSEIPLSAYNLRDGSIVKVSVHAEPPHESKCSRDQRKKSETSGDGDDNGGGCGSAVAHVGKMLSQFCSSIFPGH